MAFLPSVWKSPSTSITHWLGIHFTPRQCHRFEYQTPIKATSLGLFEHHHAVRGRWAARGKGSWNYWVKILMERSQSPWRCGQRLVLMFSKLHLGNRQFYLFRQQVDWAWSTCSFSAPPSYYWSLTQSLPGDGGQPQLPTGGHSSNWPVGG